ncbi:MAG TPA: hypothetical protein VJH03_15835 [Blastocatellia bacterium]|nr:hypothetical protein [Blastocatellia bacterium]
MRWFSFKVKVNLIDDTTGESLGIAELPPADLPESFALDTTLHLGDDDWRVVDASPKTRDEYAESKALTLRLRRIERSDPRNVLYSLPSICDAIPALNDQPLSGTELVLAEDDWRQFELVSGALAREVDGEIAKIRLIHENAAAGVGWNEIHVRTKPEAPLVCNLTFADLARALNVSAELNGVTYHGASSRIGDGYSLTTKDGLTLYGVAPNGNVKVIAFGHYSRLSPNAGSIDRLKSLAKDLDLDLVYWCRCARIAPDDPLFDSLLSDHAA